MSKEGVKGKSLSTKQKLTLWTESCYIQSTIINTYHGSTLYVTRLVCHIYFKGKFRINRYLQSDFPAL